VLDKEQHISFFRSQPVTSVCEHAWRRAEQTLTSNGCQWRRQVAFRNTCDVGVEVVVFTPPVTRCWILAAVDWSYGDESIDLRLHGVLLTGSRLSRREKLVQTGVKYSTSYLASRYFIKRRKPVPSTKWNGKSSSASISMMRRVMVAGRRSSASYGFDLCSDSSIDGWLATGAGADFLPPSSCLSLAASLLCLRSRCAHKFVVPIPSFFVPPRDTTALHTLHGTLLLSIQLSSNSVRTILFFEPPANDVPNCTDRLDIFRVRLTS